MYYLEEDYENVIKAAEDGLELTRREEQNQGIKLSRQVIDDVLEAAIHANRCFFSVRLAFNVQLAVSLVHFYPPKHHARARRIIDDVLHDDTDNTNCLMGLGYVLEFAKKWGDASEAFCRVVELLPNDFGLGLRAKEELAWSKSQLADPDHGVVALKEVLTTLDTLDGRDHDQARCWWRLGQCYWAMTGMISLVTH